VVPGAPPQQAHFGGTTVINRMSDVVASLLPSNEDERMIAARAVEERHPVWKFRWISEERR
jgi:hypothetical protein